MTTGDVGQVFGTGATPGVIRLGAVTPSWLATQLDEQGMVRLREALSPDWIDAMRRSVMQHVDRHPDGDVFLSHADAMCPPAHQLSADPALLRLFGETAMLGYPRAGSTSKVVCNIPVRNGFGPSMPSHRFHYDPSVLTMVVPLFIPRKTVGNCGELVAFGNRRPFRRLVAAHLVETALTQNPVYRRRLVKKLSTAHDEYIVDLHPGDAYVFWGYRQLHGNLTCEPGLLRATLVIAFGEVHPGSRTLKFAWRLSRSRRYIGRFRRSESQL